MKRFAGTGFAIFALAGLMAYFFLIEIPDEQKAHQEKIKAQKLLDFSVNEVEEVILKHQDITLHSRITPKFRWELVEPLNTAADPQTIETLLMTLEDARTSRVVDEAPQDLKPFGLDPPVHTLSVILKDKKKLTVELGKANPVGHSLYVKRAGEQAVLLIPSFDDEWNQSLYDFRDKTVLGYSTKTVTGFRLQNEQSRLDFNKEGDEWTFTGKITAKGDGEAIENLLNAIRTSRIQSFEEEQPKDLSKYGLDKPTMEFSPTDGTRLWSLKVGNKHPGGGAYAITIKQGNVFVINSELINNLQTNYLDLIDKRLMTLNENEVVSVTMQKGKESLTATAGKEPTLWNLKAPLKGPADAATINSLLFDLKQARAHEFVTFGEHSAFGLDSPKHRVTVHFKDGRQQSLSLGNPNLSGSQFFASRSEDDSVFILTEETARKLFRSLSDFKNHKLLNFTQDEVQTIRMQYPNQTFEIMRDEKGWKLNTPETINNIPERVGRDILWTLDHLEFTEEVTKEAAASQFETPALTVSLIDKNKKEVSGIQIGNPSKKENRIFARTGDNYFLISRKFLDQIPHTLETFKNGPG